MNQIKTYKDLKDRKWEGEGIPKWIFKTGPYTVDTLPFIIKYIYNEMVDNNSGYELFFFSDEECVEFINEEFGQYYLNLYNRLKPGAYKADLFRYLLLYNYGGIYGDFSQVMVMKFDDITNNMDRVFCVDEPWSNHSLHNAFMACKAGDLVVDKAIKMSIRNIDTLSYGEDPLDITGPAVLGKAYNSIMYPRDDIKRKIKIGITDKNKIYTHPLSADIHIKDVEGNDVLVRKLTNHFEYMYNNDVHYGHHWWNKTVFLY